MNVPMRGCRIVFLFNSLFCNEMPIRFFLLLFTLVLTLTSCNKDDVIEDSSLRPEIILDSDTGVYTVKTGCELTISPTVENAAGASYSWIIDDEVVGTGPALTVKYDEVQEVYVTFRVVTPGGRAEADLRIDVVQSAPPVISLIIPEGGIKVLPNTDYEIVPDFGNADDDFSCRWLIDGKEVGSGPTYTFREAALGAYTVTVEATNADGSTSRDIVIEVVSELPVKAWFNGPLHFSSSDERSAVAGRPTYLQVLTQYIASPEYIWKVNGVRADCDTDVFSFIPDRAGRYTVTVSVTDQSADVTATAEITVVAYSSQGAMRPAGAGSSRYSDKVYEFLPGPGQFIGLTGTAGGYSGNEITPQLANDFAQSRLDSKLFLSLGAFGGYVVVGFDHSIKSGTAEYDFAIGGNAFDDSSEPGIVWVMQDTNGNGLPDDEWFELRGSETGQPSTLQNYSVTYYRPGGDGMNVKWTDSEGNSGTVDFLSKYHAQPSYYPAWLSASSYTLRGTRLAPNNTRNPVTGFWINHSYGWGYADNYGSDKLTGGDGSDGTNQRTGFKLSNAMLPDGTAVSLSHIDFIKVQTAVNTKSGQLGESSSEIFFFQDLSL